MARGRKTGGRQKGARNRATEEARAAAKATGILPLEYMLRVMRDPNADTKRRDAMATAAAPYLHPRVGAVEGIGVHLTEGRNSVAHPDQPRVSVAVSFVDPPNYPEDQ
jgi:hypothetical protein